MKNILIEFGSLLYHINDIRNKKKSRLGRYINISLAIYNFRKYFFNISKITDTYLPEDIINLASFICTAESIELFNMNSDIKATTTATTEVGTVFASLYCDLNGSKISIESTFNELTKDTMRNRHKVSVSIESAQENKIDRSISSTHEYNELSKYSCFSDKGLSMYECAIMAIRYIQQKTINEVCEKLKERYLK